MHLRGCVEKDACRLGLENSRAFDHRMFRLYGQTSIACVRRLVYVGTRAHLGRLMDGIDKNLQWCNLHSVE